MSLQKWMDECGVLTLREYLSNEGVYTAGRDPLPPEYMSFVVDAASDEDIFWTEVSRDEMRKMHNGGWHAWRKFMSEMKLDAPYVVEIDDSDCSTYSADFFMKKNTGAGPRYYYIQMESPKICKSAINTSVDGYPIRGLKEEKSLKLSEMPNLNVNKPYVPEIEDSHTSEEKTFEIDELRNLNIKSGNRMYDPKEDRYTLKLANVGFVNVSGDEIRSMYHMYSKYGLNLTRESVARNLNMSRDLIIKIFDALSLTKESLPVTEERLSSVPPDSLVEEIEENRKTQVMRRLEQKRYSELEKRLVESENANRIIERVFKQVIDDKEFLEKPPVELADNEVSVFWGMHDQHWGKKPYDDESYTIKDQLREMNDAADRVVNKIAQTPNVGEIVTVFGSDMFHVDTWGKTTTKGTQQDMMTNIEHMAGAIVEHFVMCVNKAKLIAPVTIYAVSGNHDTVLTAACAQFLRFMFRDDPLVRVISNQNVRKYHAVGDTLICVMHGDVKAKNLTNVMHNEAREIYPDVIFKRTIVMQGHLHSFKINVHTGVNETYTTATSSSKTDEWTTQNYGKSLDRLVTVYYIEKNGPISRIDFVNVGD